MSYTTLKLITNAFHASGIVPREFQQVSGPQVEEGLDYLNEILTDKVVEDDMIPYYTKYNFTGVIGQEVYFVPDLIQLDTLVFFIDTVRYQMNYAQRIQYFGVSRANNINSLPIMYHVERQKGGANIYVYFPPVGAYPFEAWGLFGLSSTFLTQDLALILDNFYISYLKYALAERICINYDYRVPDSLAKTLKWYQAKISKRSQQLDLTIAKTSTLVKSTAINYAQVNLGRAWTIP